MVVSMVIQDFMKSAFASLQARAKDSEAKGTEIAVLYCLTKLPYVGMNSNQMDATMDMLMLLEVDSSSILLHLLRTS